MQPDEEENIRLHGVIKILEDQLDKERRAYLDETRRLNDEIHRLNTILTRIKYSASDFSEVMAAIREYSKH